jgi:hypothetical protein
MSLVGIFKPFWAICQIMENIEKERRMKKGGFGDLLNFF